METYDADSSCLRPLKRPKEYYSANDFFIIRLPSNLRSPDGQEFHIGKGICNRSDTFKNWTGNEVSSRMQKKYCFNPTVPCGDVNIVKSPCPSYDERPTVSSGDFNTSELLPPKRPRNNWQPSQIWLPFNHSINTVGVQNVNDYVPYTERSSGTYFDYTKNTINMDVNPNYLPSNNCEDAYIEKSRGISYWNDYVPNRQKSRGAYFHPKNNKLNVRNNAFIGSQVTNEALNGFANHLSPYKQRKGVQNEYKLKISEKKEGPHKIKGSKLFSALPTYQNELLLISMLQHKNPKCVIFCCLNDHYRFLHNLPEYLPPDVHLVICFNRVYKFPTFVNAAVEQLFKTERIHLHPDSNCRSPLSQEYFFKTINKAHSELRQNVMFIILVADTPEACGLVIRLSNSGRNTMGLKPNFDFSEFYSVFKSFQSSSSSG